MNKRDSIRASVFMAMGVFSFSATEALVKLLGQKISTPELLFWRGLFAIPLLAYLWMGGYTKGFQSKSPIFHIVRSIGGMIAVIATIVSLRHLDLVEFTFVFFTAPLLGSILAWLILKETLHKESIIALVLGFLGIFVILWPTFQAPSGSLVGYGAALIAALTYSGSMLAGKKIALKDDPLVYLYFYTVTCIVYGFVGMESFHTSCQAMWGQQSTGFLLLLLAIMAVVNLSANLFVNAALRLESTQKLFPFQYLSLPFAMMWSWLLWHKLPSVHTLFGGGLIFLAVGILMFPRVFFGIKVCDKNC